MLFRLFYLYFFKKLLTNSNRFGTVGIIGVSVNYPIYKKLLASGKKKYAFEIMTLAKEISESDK